MAKKPTQSILAIDDDLENDPDSPRFIVTVAGVGYQYMADADNEI